MFNNTSKLSIIMDEIDGCLSGDKGGVKQIIKMITPGKQKTKTKKTKTKTQKQKQKQKQKRKQKQTRNLFYIHL